MEWFIWLVFGHLFGDYAFQNSWMATNKKNLEIACLVHCTIYAFTVSTFLWFGGVQWSFLLFALLFASHWVLDYTLLVDKWIRFVDTRSWDTDIPRKCNRKTLTRSFDEIEWNSYMTTRQILQTIFGSVIYIVIDNTCHLFMMFLIVKWLQ